MDALDILYTPLDTPEVPDFDMNRLLKWIAINSASQEIPGRKDASLHPTVTNSYPWNIIYPRLKGSWQYNFDKEFPQIAEYFYKVFGMNEEELFNVILLPVKTEFAGLGFWHSDPDFGLRVYLENQEDDNFLHIRPTAQPYTTRPVFGLNENFNGIEFQDKTFSAILQKPKQTFYLNNVRAVHAVNTVHPGAIRIAAIITGVEDNLKLKQQFNDLVVRSAKKYKDLAIFWEPQK